MYGTIESCDRGQEAGCGKTQGMRNQERDRREVWWSKHVRCRPMAEWDAIRMRGKVDQLSEGSRRGETKKRQGTNMRARHTEGEMREIWLTISGFHSKKAADGPNFLQSSRSGPSDMVSPNYWISGLLMMNWCGEWWYSCEINGWWLKAFSAGRACAAVLLWPRWVSRTRATSDPSRVNFLPGQVWLQSALQQKRRVE